MLEINPGVAIWTIITFLILVVILKKVAWGPIIEALTRREESIRKALEDAQRAKEEAER